ncbi:hypothetical protein K492DRAFT_186587 [Lichtheimia hyalospora FSU 10163]|nr:hypothetical protein K492DRAFT_186587 [Lichtheimia hyalospora FSU 10163]
MMANNNEAINLLRDFQKETVKFTNAVEFRDPVTLQVEGKIPEWLNGILYRIGPGKFNLGDKNGSQHVIHHAFDGLAFVHRFEINGANSTVQYNSRMTAEGAETSILKDPSQQIYYGHLPEKPKNAAVGTAQQVTPGVSGVIQDPSSRNVNVTVTPNYPLPNQFGKDETDPLVLISKTDSNRLQSVHSVTLEPKHLFNYAAYDKRFDGQLSASHHKADSKTGEIFNFTLHLGPESNITVFSIKKDHSTTVLANITHRKLPGVPEADQPRIQPPYIHAFWLTENYVILPEAPLHLTRGGMDMLLSKSFVGGMAWNEDSPGYLHVVRRDGGGHVVTLPVDPYFIFHTSNAWDTKLQDGTSVLDLDACAWYDGDIVLQTSQLGLMRKGVALSSPSESKKINGLTVPPAKFEFGNLERYHHEFNEQDISNAKATHRLIARNIEFPRHNPLDDLKPYKYLWACQCEQPTSVTNVSRYSLVKVDVETGETIKLDHERYMYTEPVFVPRPGAIESDDGVLISFTNIFQPGKDTDSCALVIVDAKTMIELSRCDIGQFSCLTFHGSFVSDVHFETSTYN